MKTFQVEIITPEGAFPKKATISAELQGTDGRLSILPGHAPMIASLAAGETRLRLEGNVLETWKTGSGTINVSHDSATLLVKSARISK